MTISGCITWHFKVILQSLLQGRAAEAMEGMHATQSRLMIVFHSLINSFKTLLLLTPRVSQNSLIYVLPSLERD